MFVDPQYKSSNPNSSKKKKKKKKKRLLIQCPGKGATVLGFKQVLPL